MVIKKIKIFFTKFQTQEFYLEFMDDYKFLFTNGIKDEKKLFFSSFYIFTKILINNSSHFLKELYGLT